MKVRASVKKNLQKLQDCEKEGGYQGNLQC